MKYNNKTGILKIDNIEFEPEKEINGGLTLDLELQELSPLLLNSNTYQDDLYIRTNSIDGFGTQLFYDLHLFKANDKIFCSFSCKQPNKYWNGNYGLATFLVALFEQIKSGNDFITDIDSLSVEDDWKCLDVWTEVQGEFTLSKLLKEYSKKLKQNIKQTELNLSGAIWKQEYETNEKLFSTELLYPLLRKMNFIDVRFTHGVREYGKDFTFSDHTQFGNLRHYGLQVKAGNMRGNVNSDIDEILGQLDDAFSMPYVEISANEERRINTFIIAISGNFTSNAKEKIANKIPPNLKGSVYMLDREKIQELIERYWK